VPDPLTIDRLAPAWEDPAIRDGCARLADSIAALPGDAVIYRGRNVLTRLTIAGREVVAKAFPAPRTLLKRLQRIGRAGKAVRAFDHAARMQALGIGTPEPLAALAAADGRAWYLCAWADGCTTVRHLGKEHGPDSDRQCAALARFIGRMHQAGAYHLDSTPGNILLREDATGIHFQVVDCNRMRFGRVGAWAGMRTLAQLRCGERLLAGYCEVRGWVPERVRWRYDLQLWLHRWNWRLKNASRPLRRKLGV
jgi:tRNA A-37 threonylcarbamoyl transferase component Bud32